jgi:hypothetical protein
MSDSDPAVDGLRLRNRCPQVEAAVGAIVVVVVESFSRIAWGLSESAADLSCWAADGMVGKSVHL